MIRLTFGVTNNSKNFTRTAGGAYKVGDLLILGDATKGSIVMEISTVTARVGGTFTQNYTGTTSASVNGDVLPVSSIDPSVDTVIKTQLVQQIVDAMAADQRNAANWAQVLSNSSSDITVTQPDGSTLTGPAWGAIVTRMLDKVSLVAQTIKAAITFERDIVAQADVSVTGLIRAPGGVTGTSYPAGSSGAVSGPRIKAEVSSAAGMTSAQIFAVQNIATGVGHMELLAYSSNPVKSNSARFNQDGSFVNYAGAWTSSSDARIKNIEGELSARDCIAGLRLQYGTKDGAPFVGGVAQEIQKNFPRAVAVAGDFTTQDGEQIRDLLAVDYALLGYAGAVVAAELVEEVQSLKNELAKLKELILTRG